MWVKLDDQYFNDPKAIAAGPNGRALDLAGRCYCAGQLTDGVVPKVAIPIVAAAAGVPRTTVKAVVASELWLEGPDCYVIPDYLETNPSGDAVKEKRAAAASRMQQVRMNHKQGSLDVRANEEGSSPNPVPVPVQGQEQRERPKRAQVPADDFDVDPALLEWAQRECPKIDLRRETSAWIDWCQANGRKYLDVRAGWKTWMRRARPIAGSQAPGWLEGLNAAGEEYAPLRPALIHPDGSMETLEVGA